MNVLIIDDHQILEEGITKRVKKVFPDAICCFADNVRTAIAKTQEIKVDLILCDLEFNNDSKNDGFFIIESILKFEPRIKAIAYTNYNSYRIMKKAIKSGFLSFLDKGCSIKEFEETLLNVVENGTYKSTTMHKLYKSRNQFTRSIFSDSIYGISDLSKKELELTLLSKDTTNRQELSKIMGNTPYTIDTYFKSITSKLKLNHRKDVAFFCAEFYDELIKAKEI
ncbi:response regulator transcription factor [uncultured Polaribacter sp.]|uniref:response regulator transcription factor n=1 Tax=uncultured Polaribacter sp. TaxID=174711 RepID=UPI0026227910|nr:response regulator transcription factor [uncultured Polaribacter sp.]